MFVQKQHIQGSERLFYFPRNNTSYIRSRYANSFSPCVNSYLPQILCSIYSFTLNRFFVQMKNKNIAKVVSDCILVLADYTDRIVELYPGLAGKLNIIETINVLDNLMSLRFIFLQRTVSMIPKVLLCQLSMIRYSLHRIDINNENVVHHK